MKKFLFTIEKNSEPLFKQLKKAMLNYLSSSNFAPGDRLPSENEFCANSAVSIRTVRRALAELERDGVIIRRQGLGTFLADPPEELLDRRTIGIIFSDISHVTNPVFLNLLHSIEEDIVSREWNFHLYAMGKRDNGALPLEQILPQELPDALIATSALNHDDLRWLREKKIPFCAFNCYRDMRINNVRFDYSQAAIDGLCFLKNLGIKKVIALIEHRGNSTDAVIYGHDIFCEAAEQYAKEQKMDFQFVIVPQNRPSSAQVAAKLFYQGQYPQAFITFTPLVAEGIQAVEHELKIPSAKLLCCHEAPETGATALLRCDLASMGHQAVNLVSQMLQGDPTSFHEKILKLKLETSNL